MISEAEPDSFRIRVWVARLFRLFALPTALGVSEQIVSSGANFVFLALLARLMGLQQFGLYSVAWSGVMLAEGISSSIFGDTGPAIINKLSRADWPRFRGAYYLSSIGITAALCVACALVALIGRYHPSLVLLSCLAALAMRTQQTFRRFCYIEGRRGLALTGAAMFAFTILASVVLLGLARQRAAEGGMLALALGCAAPGLLLARRSYLQAPDRGLLAWTWRHAWASGRWLLIATFCYWVTNLGLIPFAAVMFGSGAGASLRVLQALTNPLSQLGVVFASLVLPLAAERLANASRRRFLRISWPPIVVMAGVAAAYALTLTAWGAPLARYVFPGKSVLISVSVLACGSVAAAFDVVETLITLPQIALNRTFGFLVARVSSTVTLLLAFALLGARYGFFGLILAMAAANFVQAAVAGGALFVEYLRRPVSSDGTLNRAGTD